jgi:ABC-type transport system involved in multi-copper enzyme maturation permease subunit
MNWFAWQQHKKQFMIFGILLVLFAALVIPTGMQFWNTYQNALVTCDATDTCGSLADTLFQSKTSGQLMMFMEAAIVLLPFILAMFLGVPLIAREYAKGTNLLVWTQGISRRKWLGVKLAWVLLATAIIAGAFAALSTWWWRTGNLLFLDKFQPLNFGLQGFAPVAFAIFAVAVGIAFGALFKRTLVAIACTLGLLVVAQIAIPTLVRPHYAKPATYTMPMNTNAGKGGTPPDQAPTPPNAGAAWVTSGALKNPAGQALDWDNPPAQCSFTRQQIMDMREQAERSSQRANTGGYFSRDSGPMISISCLAQQGYTWHVQYHPSYRYWNFQRIEAALYLALTLIPLSATFLLVQKRDA